MSDVTRTGEDKERCVGYSIDVCEKVDNDGDRVLTLNFGHSLNKSYEVFTVMCSNNLHRPGIVYIRLCYRPAHKEPWHVLSRRTREGVGDW